MLLIHRMGPSLSQPGPPLLPGWTTALGGVVEWQPGPRGARWGGEPELWWGEPNAWVAGVVGRAKLRGGVVGGGVPALG